MSYPSTRLADPVTVTLDYERRPIQGQLSLFPRDWFVSRADGGAWLRAMLETHGHNNQ